MEGACFTVTKKLKQKVLKVLKSVLKQAVCVCCGVTHACANPVQAQDNKIVICALFERERSQIEREAVTLCERREEENTVLSRVGGFMGSTWAACFLWPLCW